VFALYIPRNNVFALYPSKFQSVRPFLNVIYSFPRLMSNLFRPAAPRKVNIGDHGGGEPSGASGRSVGRPVAGPVEVNNIAPFF